ncbi:uncharacterized protein LOC134697148 [Mytilus trossulus]|uniref:uncharacterized protein LOC134697148 n=1 Tax=Mytilus trossulus TaxID=6551 RepID=UPI003004A4C8
MLPSNKLRISLQDVCVKRGADAASDHHLLMGKVRTKLRKIDTMKKSTRQEKMPQQWNEGRLLKLLKKGNPKECKNYREIELLPLPAKVLNRILLIRLLNAIEESLREQQAGFSKDRS